MRRVAALCACLALAACGAGMGEMPARLPPSPSSLPPMKTFAAPPPDRPLRSNAQMAQDFLDLSFEMESGRPLPYMTRFDGPVSLRVTGPLPPGLEPDLAILLSRLRREAGIDIRRVPADQEANVTIEMVPRDQVQRLVPQAACFVAPRVSNWDDYRHYRRSGRVDWTTLKTREQVAIFIPADVSPQEVRDCLNEELAQALGPLNDLYRLPDSVFNDDNFHTVLTGFDMLMLRLYYAPEFHNGTTRAEAAALVPGLLARNNPAGERAHGAPLKPSPREWIDAIETALGPGTRADRRLAAAQRAVRIARAEGWTDSRLAFSYFALGRLSLETNGEAALRAFLQAGQIYAARPETQLQAAHVAMHLAAFALASGPSGAPTARRLVDDHLNEALQSQNAALLATMLLIKAEALETEGRSAEARTVRSEALGWARYGFGSDTEVRARLAEIASLNAPYPM